MYLSPALAMASPTSCTFPKAMAGALVEFLAKGEVSSASLREALFLVPHVHGLQEGDER